MLDVEFISEVAVAHLYGLQNKKTSLDRFYKDFESEFPDRDEVERTFATVLGEIDQILDWPTTTRWSKKTDFYTLFLVLAAREREMPFDRETRGTLRDRLATFSTAVAGYLSSKDLGPGGELDQARGYSRGVRASSDLGSRRIRNIALASYLFDLPYQLPADLADDAGTDDAEGE